MSGAQTSTFGNVLFDPLMAGRQQAQTNQLAGQQIDLSNANQAQVQAAAAGLLSGFPDEASRAEAYPKYVGMLQSQGYAKNAPAQYPGEAYLRAIVNQGIPAKDLYSSGALMTPAQQQLLSSTQPPTSTTNATAPPAAGGSAGGPSFAGGIAGFESGGVSNPPENPRWPVAKGGPAGPHQFIASTWNSFAQANPDLFKGMTPDQILAARTDTTPVGPNGEDRSTLATNWYAGENAKVLQASNIAPTPANLGIAHALGAGGATKVLSAPDNTPLSQVIPETIAQNPEYGRMTVGDLKQRYARLGPVGGSGTATAAATPAPAPAGGVAARTGGTDTAGPAAGTTPPTAAPAGPPAAQQPSQFKYSDGRIGSAPDAGGGVHFADGNYGTPAPGPSVPVSASATPPVAGAAPAQPVPATAQAGTSRLPEVSTIPTGQNSAPYKQAQAMIQEAMRYDAVAGTNPAFAKRAADLKAIAAGILQTGATVSAQQDGRPGTLEVVTGKFTPYTPLPSPRFSQPTIDPATGKPAIAAVSGSGTQYFPIPASPAQADYENMKAAYTGDIPTVKTIAESGRAAQASALQLNELADVIKGVQSGGILPEFRAKVAALMEANGAKPETIQAMTGMSSGSDAQVLQKLAVATIGASAKSDLGSNVGVESLNLYAGANPGMDKLQDANKRVTNMIRVAREQIESYSLGAQQHFNQNQSTMLHTPAGQVPDYHPLSEYNQQWQAQNNPQIGAAAIGILNGDGFDKWAARAGPAEALNAVRLAARIDPNVQIPMPDGSFKTAQEVLSHGVGR